MFFHLQALTRLGLLRRVEDKSSRQYVLDEATRERVDRLASVLPDIRVLEKTLEADEWEQVGRTIYGSEREGFGDDVIFHHLIATYRFVEQTQTPLVSLSTLTDAVKVRALAESCVPPKTDSVLRVLMRAQSKHPRQIRLHVDRKGLPAFVKISKAITDAVLTSS
jgi:hypothetical protein